MTEVENFESSTPMRKIQRVKSNQEKIKIDKSWISSFANHIKINQKNATKLMRMVKLSLNPNY